MKPLNALRDQQGVMLLEGLIAILIFSMGILGLMGLQAASIKSVTDSKFRTDAAFFANRIISQMWVDDKTNLSTLYATGGTKYSAWLTEMQNSQTRLPGSTGANAPTVTFNTIPGLNFNQVTVTLFWQAPNDPNRHQYTAVAQIN